MFNWFFERYLERYFDTVAELADRVVLDRLRLFFSTDRTGILETLNRQFDGEVELLAFNACEPEIRNLGPVSLTPEQASSAEDHRRWLSDHHRPNDPHAILDTEPLWVAEPVQFHVRTIDFAGIRALRDLKQRPAIISSGAVLLCAETSELILHRRDESADTYPSKLHVLGGAYMPPGTPGADSDRGGLRSTAAREIFEETQASIVQDDDTPMLLAREVSTGFIQLLYLGVQVPRMSLSRLSSNWEGAIEKVPFDGLLSVLRRGDWVPSGKAHVLAWLALNAPGAKRGQLFSGYKARKLFDILSDPSPQRSS